MTAPRWSEKVKALLGQYPQEHPASAALFHIEELEQEVERLKANVDEIEEQFLEENRDALAQEKRAGAAESKLAEQSERSEDLQTMLTVACGDLDEERERSRKLREAAASAVKTIGIVMRGETVVASMALSGAADRLEAALRDEPEDLQKTMAPWLEEPKP